MREAEIQTLASTRSQKEKQTRLQLAATAMTAILNNPAYAESPLPELIVSSVKAADLLIEELEK